MNEPAAPAHFIQTIIDDDLQSGKNDGRVHTRFPPEPNGYLHIGHAKSICLNFGLARQYNGKCNLRFDDTNPAKEEQEYVESIQEDVRWLGFDWEERLFYASDYFGQLHEWALHLIREGKAYVCDLNAEQVREYRGTLTEPGRPSPFRDRSVDENLDLFARMRAGEFAEGARTLRAKIDMAHPNINMRDPVIYRIIKRAHHRTGDTWCIYPSYDFTHGQSDALEGITHSICTLEFEDHRPLYEWFIENLPVPCLPRQIEFARLELTYTVLSKRKLLTLVGDKHVSGWDDPRMPTISGLRRRGYPPQAIRLFAEKIGVSKANSTVEFALLEFCVREELNKSAPRRMAVLDPLKLIIENYPEGEEELLEAENNPEDPGAGSRQIPFCREIYIEKNDFMVDPPKKFFRLAPGREIRLKHAYYVTCTSYETDPQTGEVTLVRCSYDPASRGGWTDDGRRVKGTSHWVSARHALSGEVRIYDHLFTAENPNQVPEGSDFTVHLNPDSLQVRSDCKLEPSLAQAQPGERFQFLRLGYYCADTGHSAAKPVFNRTVGLVDTWAKKQKAAAGV